MSEAGGADPGGLAVVLAPALEGGLEEELKRREELDGEEMGLLLSPGGSLAPLVSFPWLLDERLRDDEDPADLVKTKLVAVIGLATDDALEGSESGSGLCLGQLALSHPLLISSGCSCAIITTPRDAGGAAGRRIFPLLKLFVRTIIFRRTKKAGETVRDKFYCQLGQSPIGIVKNTNLLLDGGKDVVIRPCTDEAE
jgi:hypothetical protein